MVYNEASNFVQNYSLIFMYFLESSPVCFLPIVSLYFILFYFIFILKKKWI